MELMITVKGVSVEYNGKELLDIPELQIYDYDRIGMVGSNGAGKSTLLHMLYGDGEQPQYVARSGKLGFLEQLVSDPVAQEEVAGEQKKRFKVNEICREHASGGEETRLKIAKVFSQEYDGLLMDEPTVNLDLEGRTYFMERLKEYSGMLIIVSHDRYLLNQTVDKIWELKDGTIHEYYGNYDDYISQKQEERRCRELSYQQYQNEQERLQRIIAEKREHADKIRKRAEDPFNKNKSNSAGIRSASRQQGTKEAKLYQVAKSFERKTNQLTAVAPPEKEQTLTFYGNKECELHNKYPIMGKEITKSYGTHVLLKDTDFTIPLGRKVLISGANGSGKSTLLSMIQHRENGTIVSPKAQMGYYTQLVYREKSTLSILEYLKRSSDYPVSRMISALYQMGFEERDLRKKMNVLSGGELSKIYLIQLFIGNYNILLLDEPSNFLDTEAVDALEAFIRDYKGTVIFVSHDQKLNESAADMEYCIMNQKLVLIRDERFAEC